jgi:hypothetical protein
MFRINGIVLLISFILLGDCNTERLHDRKNMCFSLMDFDDAGEITVDELVRLLLFGFLCFHSDSYY